MDVSVVAAVGSFFMSERVLKPKATVLFILGLVLAYDLTTKTHDVLIVLGSFNAVFASSST